jgi:hypothetical protein
MATLQAISSPPHLESPLLFHHLHIGIHKHGHTASHQLPSTSGVRLCYSPICTLGFTSMATLQAISYPPHLESPLLFHHLHIGIHKHGHTASHQLPSTSGVRLCYSTICTLGFTSMATLQAIRPAAFPYPLMPWCWRGGGSLSGGRVEIAYGSLLRAAPLAPRLLVSYLTRLSVSRLYTFGWRQDDWWTSENLDGCGRGLLALLSRYLPGGTEKIIKVHKQDSRCPSRD